MQALHHSTMSPVTALDSPSGASGSSGASSSSGSSSSDTTVTANDFLTLLVAEMKNQDPTSDTDPNAYIDQLVQVNSLQQLIQINQDLGGLNSSSSSSSDSGSGSGGNGGSNPSSQAIDAASRLATSLTPRHPQPEGTDGNPVSQSQDAAAQAATAFQTAIHKS